MKKIYSIVLVKRKIGVTSIRLFTGIYDELDTALKAALAEKENEGHHYHIHTVYEIENDL